MGTMNISLPQELEVFVHAKVNSGEYAHASEVVRDALRVFMQNEAEKLEWLRKAVARGIADADAGRLIPAERAFEEVKRRRRKHRASR